MPWRPMLCPRSIEEIPPVPTPSAGTTSIHQFGSAHEHAWYFTVVYHSSWHETTYSLRNLKVSPAHVGLSVFSLDLTGLSDQSTLVDYLAEVFMFPHEAMGLDAEVDLISGLEWFGNADGYLIVVRGLADSLPVADSFVSILPSIVERWRSQAVPFVVVLDGKSERLQSAIFTANRAMGDAGRLPWAQPGTGAVNVVVHGVGILSQAGELSGSSP
jgi:hypothetical protein